MIELSRWLDARRPAPPPSLRAAIQRAIRRSDPGAGPLHMRLAATGLETLRRVAALPSTREHAEELLAADALITYACEAAVEADGVDGADGGDALEALTAALGPARFAGLLPGGGPG